MGVAADRPARASLTWDLRALSLSLWWWVTSFLVLFHPLSNHGVWSLKFSFWRKGFRLGPSIPNPNLDEQHEQLI